MAISAQPLSASSPTLGAYMPPKKKIKMLSCSFPGPIHLSQRFAALKESIVSGRGDSLVWSWHQLLGTLWEEVDLVASLGSRIVPTIDFADIGKPEYAQGFQEELRARGVAVIRNVVPRDTALDWEDETRVYLDQNPNTKTPARDSKLHEVYWSSAQVQARAHPNILAAQKFAMGAWKSKDPNARISTNFPITYADRMRIRTKGETGLSAPSAHIDGGSVERWEPDGTRIPVASDFYRGAGSCSIFRAFQGWLAVSSMSSPLQVCPMPQLATAYFLLRPFFSRRDVDGAWDLTRPQNSLLHGALPSYTQEISHALHPHLQLDRSLVSVPRLEPGDYVIWHPDLIHVANGPHVGSHPSSAAMYLPACPLTQTNALYLCRQRKAFLLGCPGPDFGGGRSENDSVGQPGVQEVNEAGREDGLRAMGLLPWDEEDADSDVEREVLAMANAILFPDLYDML
ncbi:hypothetical protein B0H67DRAFT_639819 [Lasiosphaeris hirsuta]|uniref:DUF1479-domain-containing protein n=1 Tax=Lasiosphaeris hirsuta TaxID=260670 RepID=A0AA40E943_9PEZI|nr:hypothetical protein B0H67DRAFT_639819 [Lasiosphaeris hirsuta]